MNDFRTEVEGQRPYLLRCAACGAPFHCGKDERDCWCAGLPLLKPIPGKDCLCRECLERQLKKQT